MKKFLSVLVFAICILSMNFCSAYYPHEYYDGDPYYYDTNYRYVWCGNDYTNFYISLKSIDVQEYNPPHYQIAGTFVSYSGYYHKVGRSTYSVKRYNWYTKESFSLKNGYWEKDRTGGTDNISISSRRFADALFRAAYRISFYGY